MKQIILKDDVAKAMRDLAAQGKKPTLALLHAALQHRGSMSTLIRLKAEVESEAQPVTESPEALKTFREVWALAVEEGRSQQESVIVELRETVKSLSAENERLDGTAIAAQERAEELQLAATRLETEFKRAIAATERRGSEAQEAALKAKNETAEALQTLAKTQTEKSVEIAYLQSDLAKAVAKAHELELKLVRAQALLEAKGGNSEIA